MMPSERPTGEVSRRNMLKRIGAGAAIAWSAPVLSSLTSPAFGQGSSPDRCTFTCRPFVDISCGNCGNDPAAPPRCRCNRTVEGDVFCWNGCTPCSAPICTTTAECGPGLRCIPDTCCSGDPRPRCLPDCGTVVASVDGEELTGARN